MRHRSDPVWHRPDALHRLSAARVTRHRGLFDPVLGSPCSALWNYGSRVHGHRSGTPGMNLLLSYQPLLDIFLLSLGFAYSQQIVLRAGVFSVATAGFASIGAYCAAILVRYHNIPAPI